MNISLTVIAHDSPAYQKTIALRYRVLREPLGLGFTPEQLAAEDSDVHIAALMNGEIVGCLVLTPRETATVQMRQVAVAPEFQGQGVGRRLVEFAEQAARERGFAVMTLHARQNVTPFYARLGYAGVGEPFVEVGLPHREMQKRLNAVETVF